MENVPKYYISDLSKSQLQSGAWQVLIKLNDSRQFTGNTTYMAALDAWDTETASYPEKGKIFIARQILADNGINLTS